MQVVTINGRVTVINETRAEAIEVFNDTLESYGLKPLTEDELRDCNISAGQTTQYLIELARDYISELQTERAQENNKHNYTDIQAD